MTATIDATLHAGRDKAWWKSAVVYQVYPRSFADSDGDGIGDLPGVLAHLDHIADLGADVLWLSPIYPSPHDDNGYDISNYQDIDPVFGTLADFDALLSAVHDRGMKLILDLVVNHTSSEHPWFLESRRGRDSAKADWYIWRDARPGTVAGQPGSEPNNWGSVFSGPAWEWAPERGQYYLHLFAVSQPDLNWDNAEVREAVYAMMGWWLDRGVDGFRKDVINFISKDPAFPDGPVTRTGYGNGMPHFSYGPRIHTYLAEMKERVFDAREGSYLTVGEMPGVTPEQAREFTAADRGQLNMVFQFEHVQLDHEGDKWTPRTVTVSDLRETLARWQTELARDGWNSLYWSNHDQPRVVSRYGNDTTFWFESATALATVLHLHRGTPYIYQGEELGMTNVPFDDIACFRDIESLNYYANATTVEGLDRSTVLATLRQQSRDNARTPMQWNAGPGAGFSTGVPWIPVNPNHVWLNAETQRAGSRSVYRYYRQLIALRRSEPVLTHGDFDLLADAPDTVYSFRRYSGEDCIEVYANLSDTAVPLDVLDLAADRTLLGNYPAYDRDPAHLAPWEVRTVRR